MTKLAELIALDNGARFHNVDLHIHSFGASHDVKDPMMTPEAIIDSAVKQGLSVISITDHNSNASVQRALDYAEKNYPSQILVLPGVEITTAHGHLLAYFAPDRTADLTKLLSRLDLIGEMGADNTRTAKSMADTIDEVEKLGGICIAAHIDREKTGFEAFALGFQNWKKDIITSSGLYGLETDSVEALEWYSEHDNGPAGTERKNIFLAREAVKVLSARRDLAHVQGSDAHAMKRFEHQNPSKPWTRMKLTELSFAAFRVALIDPTARVRATASLPLTVPRVLGIAITGGFLHSEVIRFSDNLNCFIGGRGTGKSTAIRALAYAFGLNDDFCHYDNCPNRVAVFCEDENGIQYVYVRTRGGEIQVKAKEDQSITDVPVDTFRIEYFGQGELAKIAEDPLKNPTLFQVFLDRYTNLRDLIETEKEFITNLKENASRLNPLENAFAQLIGKKASLAEIEKKLTLAEEGNLREVVGTQSKLASEKAVRESVDAITNAYTAGYHFPTIYRDFDQIAAAAGVCTADAESITTMAAMKAEIEKTNSALKAKEVEINDVVRASAKVLEKLTHDLKLSHQRMSGEVAVQMAALKASGVATDIPGLEALLKQKTSIATEIARTEQRTTERTECKDERAKLRTKLQTVRQEMTARRKAQLKNINSNLSSTMKDYTIFVRYDDAGITVEFETFLQEKTTGIYLQDNLIQNICSRISPSDLADWVLDRDYDQIVANANISRDWAEKIVDKLCYWNTIFDMQSLAKHPKPIITVKTKSVPIREIPVLQLSDGQRHTILLTIAMLAESNVPLVIDQPEDDLDNAFIFSSIVGTLRSIKEKRQVIVVTHNANIAVLGDSELILPMHRENDCGKTLDRGSIDSGPTKECVLKILEGGPDAFLRRKEMYSH